MSMNPRVKRYKVNVACERCRQRKIKCDGVRPACGHCQKKTSLREHCVYREDETRSSISEQTLTAPTSTPHLSLSPLGNPPLPPSERVQTSFSSIVGQQRSQTPSTNPQGPGGPSPLPSRQQQNPVDAFGEVSNAAFTGELRAAVEARLGLSTDGGLGQLSVMNAPFFSVGSQDRRTVSTASDRDFVLPPRRYADQLVDVFWRYVHPLEPLLDEASFRSSYDALFAGHPVDGGDRLFVGLLNVMFALSAQMQDSADPVQRDQTSGTYFQRSWNLLHHAPSVIWEQPSCELIQCLLLMSSYLKCANNPHQTWMVAGTAVLLAQSLALHRTDRLYNSRPSELKKNQRVWLACIYIDRVLSMTYGRPALISENQALAAIDTFQQDYSDLSSSQSSIHLLKAAELFEIGHRAVQLLYDQRPAPSSFAQRVSLHHHPQNSNEAHEISLHFDECLSKWEEGLPSHLKFEREFPAAEEVHQRQALALCLRAAHVRIIMFRPLLVRFCLSHSPEPTAFQPKQGLSARLVRDCAHLCVANARSIISLISKNFKADGSVALIPAWWFRVYYVHVAATVLIAAKLQSDLSTQFEVLDAWEQAIALLQAHQHFSAFIPQSISNLENLSAKVWESHTMATQEGSTLQDEPPNAPIEDLFRDIGFDPNHPAFGLEDIDWLNSFNFNTH